MMFVCFGYRVNVRKARDPVQYLVIDSIPDLSPDLAPDLVIDSIPDLATDLAIDSIPDLAPDSTDLLHSFFCDSSPPGWVNPYFKVSKQAWVSID